MTAAYLNRKAFYYGFGAVILLILPYVVHSVYLLHVINMILINSIVVSGLNIIMGYTGQFMLAQASFYGVGAYASAILATRLGLPFLDLPAVCGSHSCLRRVTHQFALLTGQGALPCHSKSGNRGSHQ